MLLELDGNLSSGQGVSTDILEASGRAYLRALTNAIASASSVSEEAERHLEEAARGTPTP